MAEKKNKGFEYARSVKSDFSDELINSYFLRPIAGVLVRVFYPTPITPNQLTVAAILVGACAALFYSIGEYRTTIIAGVLITLKDLLDSADGQLARAKNLFSRRGRFIDSIGDFVVDLLVFSAITLSLYRVEPASHIIFLGLAGVIGITLRVSYHVFYHVSYLHLEDQYQTNRLIEEIREEDRHGDPVALRLQQIFLFIYSWQDKLMYRLDEWSKSARGHSPYEQHQFFERLWYSDRVGLRLSGLLGLGTELALLTLCSLLNELSLYLWLNLLLMNGIWLVSILYRKLHLAPSLLRLSTSRTK